MMDIVRKALKLVIPAGARNAYRLVEAHRSAHGRYPRLLRPRTFSEKVCHRLMFDRRPILTQLADKYGSRAYIEERLGSEKLPRLYHVTQEPATIPWETLPSRYVIKGTHGSGWVKLVTGSIDRVATERLCSEWLQQNYYWMHREWPYRNIVPRIMIEEFLDDGSGGVPADYKLFVFNGEPAIIQVDASRFTGHTRAFYDLEWKRLPVTLTYPAIPGEIPPPVHLHEMIEAAAELARGMDFLRVDLYDLPTRFYAGELTTTPGGGLEVFKPMDFDEALGKRWR